MAPAPMFSTENAFTEFLAANIWIPILAISAAVLIVIFIVICVWKCRGSTGYDYSILKADFALPQKLEMERKLQYDTMRETALLHCQFYLRSSGIYTPVEHLSEIGSRVGKHWFMVRDTRSKVDKLLTMVPRRHQYLLPFTSATRATLLSILQAIQHPYIYPIYDLDLLSEQGRIVLILPYNSKGSLKDIIYHTQEEAFAKTRRTLQAHLGKKLHTDIGKHFKTGTHRGLEDVSGRIVDSIHSTLDSN